MESGKPLTGQASPWKSLAGHRSTDNPEESEIKIRRGQRCQSTLWAQLDARQHGTRCIRIDADDDIFTRGHRRQEDGQKLVLRGGVGGKQKGPVRKGGIRSGETPAKDRQLIDAAGFAGGICRVPRQCHNE